MNSMNHPKVIKFKKLYPHENWLLLDDYLAANPHYVPSKISLLIHLAMTWDSSNCPFNSGKVEVVHQFNNGFKVVKLIDQVSREWESFHMRSCVRKLVDNPDIFSLRDKNNIPHCTMEITKNEFELQTLEQAKGVANTWVSPKYIQMILDFLTIHNIEMVGLNSLGFYELSTEEASDLSTHFTGAKITYIENIPHLYIFKKIKPKASYKKYSEKFLNFFLLSKNIKAIQHLMFFFKNNQEPMDHTCIFGALLCNDFDLVKKLIQPEDSFNYWRGRVADYVELGYTENLSWFINTLLEDFFPDQANYGLILHLLLDCQKFEKFNEILDLCPANYENLNKDKGALLWNALVYSVPRKIIKNLISKGADINRLDIQEIVRQKHIYPYLDLILPQMNSIPFIKREPLKACRQSHHTRLSD